MRNPDPPYLELGFYFRHKSGREALKSVAETFTSHFCAIPTSACVVDQTTASLFYSNSALGPGRLVKLRGADDLARLLKDSTRLVRQVRWDGGTQVVRDTQEILAVLPIEGADCKSESNVVAIWIEGTAFSRPRGTEISKTEKQVAARALTAFEKLISLLRPTYASITVDYGLENPCDLRHDSRSLAFRDFFLDRGEFGERFIEELKARFPNCYCYDHEAGIITITSAAFLLAAGQDPVKASDVDYELSRFVAASIGMLLSGT